MHKNFIPLLFVCVFALPVYAQVCLEPTVGPKGAANLTCDMTYRNTVVACYNTPTVGGETLGTTPACPNLKRPMPMITTPKASFVADYNTSLFTVPHDAKDGTAPYNGTYSIGTSGDASQTFQMFGKGATGGIQLAACKSQLSLPSLYTTDEKGVKHFNSAKDEARFNRLQIDNCTNQYILNTALYPYQKENPTQLSLENPADPSEKISLKTACQPLKIVPEKNNEYNAADYLKAAWTKMLIDPGYRKSTPNHLKGIPCISSSIPCDHEPHLPEKTTIAEADKIPIPDDFPEEILLSSLSAIQSEEIVDPTHPFSPRWDYRLSDRDYNNGLIAAANGSGEAATIYGLNRSYWSETDNAVFCAGLKKKTLFSQINGAMAKFEKLSNLTDTISKGDFSKITDQLTPEKLGNMVEAKATKELEKITALGEKGLAALEKFSNLDPAALQKMGADQLQKLSDFGNIDQNALKNIDLSKLPISDQAKKTIDLVRNADLSALKNGNLQAMLKLDKNATNVLSVIKTKNLDPSKLLASSSIFDTAQKLNISSASLANVNGLISKANKLGISSESMAQTSKVLGQAQKLGITSLDISNISGTMSKASSLNISSLDMNNTTKILGQLKNANISNEKINAALKISGQASSLNISTADITKVADFAKKASSAGFSTEQVSSALSLSSSADKAGISAASFNSLGKTAEAAMKNGFSNADIKIASSTFGAAQKLGISAESIKSANQIVTAGASFTGTAAEKAQAEKIISSVASAAGISNKDISTATNVVNAMKDFNVGDINTLSNAVGSLNTNLSSIASSANINVTLKGLGIDSNTPSLALKVMGSMGSANINLSSLGSLSDIMSAAPGTTLAQLADTSKITDTMKTAGIDIASLGNAGSLMNAVPGLDPKTLETANANISKLLSSDSGITPAALENAGGDLAKLTEAGNDMPSLQSAAEVTEALKGTGLENSEIASAVTNLAGSGLFEDTDDGVEKASNSTTTGDTATKNDGPVIPVDVLEFRRKPFEEAILRRATYNAACFWHKDLFKVKFDWAGVAATAASYCFTVRWTGSFTYPPYFIFTFKDCWKCFGLSGLADGEKTQPPCSTNYLSKDKKMKNVLPGGLNLFSRTAQCNYPLQKRDSKYNMDKVCRDLRKPFTPLNKLKMRYHNPDDKTNNVLKDGALEGMTFKEYFGNHMPYPKILDTGGPLLKAPSSDVSDQPPLDTTGQYTAIVGVGREAAAESAAAGGAKGADGLTPKERYTDQRCKISGWGGIRGVPIPHEPISFGGVNFLLPDPVTSWTDMKLYQTRTLRTAGMSCIGRYEKVFKPGSAENMVLLATGADWTKLVVTECGREASGKTKDCKNMSLKEYTDAGSKANSDTTIYMKDLSLQGWPNSWRGYMAAGGLLDVGNTDKNAFPNFGDGAPAGMPGKLDDAKKRDIILMPFGPKNDRLKPGLAKLALVVETHLPSDTNCEKEKNCYIQVLEPDNGKWPDICGTTDTWGQMKVRRYYKPGHLPPKAKEEYDRIGTSSNCEETRISDCEQTAWSGATGLRIYRIDADVRAGCKETTSASSCKE